MSEHPIQGLMRTAMDAIKDMVDVNTVVGAPVDTKAGGVIIPISRVSFGFAAGGGEYGQVASQDEEKAAELPFGGGSGAGVSVQPVGFLVIENGDVRLLPIGANPLFDRIMDQAPDLIDRIGSMVKGDAHRSALATSDYPR